MALHGAHLRVARPTDNIDALVPFYRDGLGFKILLRFGSHEGFDGVMLGLPGEAYHLEFITKAGHVFGKAPSHEHLLVFYLQGRASTRQQWLAWSRVVLVPSLVSTRTGTGMGRPMRIQTATASFWQI